MGRRCGKAIVVEFLVEEQQQQSWSGREGCNIYELEGVKRCGIDSTG
jgi:hypothetical protein